MSVGLLYHFTCAHGHAGVERDGFLAPHAHVLLPELGPLVWLTEDPEPDRLAVGLSSTIITCDRMAHRYDVAPETVPDLTWWPFVRDRCAPAVVADLERYGRPSTWWLARSPVLIA